MRSIISINPATGKKIGKVEAMGRRSIDRKMAAARTALGSWRNMPIRERQSYIRALSRAVVRGEQEIAALIATEQGKPVTEARIVEVLPVLSILKYLSRKAHKILRREAVDHELILFTHKRSHYCFEPYGVTVIISPWNYPFSVPVPQICAALVAGNTVVFKPAPDTVLVGVKIEELFREAGFPEGVVNLVYVRDSEAPYVAAHREVDKIVFTGSTDTGMKIIKEAASRITPVLLELGGKDPMIIAADADLAKAAKAAVWGAMFSSGQVCASVERVYVEKSVAEEFIELCSDEVEKIRVGDPLLNGVDLGPLTNKEQLRVVIDHVSDAVKRGARVVAGGRKIKGDGFFYEPTVLTHVDHSMKVMREETFGPVLPIMAVDSIDEAIRLANDSPYGLSAYGWTGNAETAARLQRELTAGSVLINEVSCTWGDPAAPWGGMKRSGIGRTRSKFGLLEMVQIKLISYDRGRKSYNPWWFPYDRGSREFSAQAIQALFGLTWRSKLRNLLGMLRNRRFYRAAHWLAIVRNVRKIF